MCLINGNPLQTFVSIAEHFPFSIVCNTHELKEIEEKKKKEFHCYRSICISFGVLFVHVFASIIQVIYYRMSVLHCTIQQKVSHDIRS